MRLRDRPPLYIALVRAPEGEDVRTTVQSKYALREVPCAEHDHLVTAHVVAMSGPCAAQRACLLCVARSRAARAIGIAGGRKGGRSTSDRKRETAIANAVKATEARMLKAIRTTDLAAEEDQEDDIGVGSLGQPT